MEKYFELGREAARLAPDFVTEMSAEVSLLYRNAWDEGYRVGYPPQEGLLPDFLRSWLEHGHFAYLAFDNSSLAGVALLAVEKLCPQLITIKSLDLLIHPEYQQRDFAQNLFLMIEEKCRELEIFK